MSLILHLNLLNIKFIEITSNRLTLKLERFILIFLPLTMEKPVGKPHPEKG